MLFASAPSQPTPGLLRLLQVSVEGNGAACAEADASAQASARAVAQAVAQALVDASNGCSAVQAVVQASAFADAFASAAAQATARACSTGAAPLTCSDLMGCHVLCSCCTCWPAGGDARALSSAVSVSVQSSVQASMASALLAATSTYVLVGAFACCQAWSGRLSCLLLEWVCQSVCLSAKMSLISGTSLCRCGVCGTASGGQPAASPSSVAFSPPAAAVQSPSSSPAVMTPGPSASRSPSPTPGSPSPSPQPAMAALPQPASNWMPLSNWRTFLGWPAEEDFLWSAIMG